MVKPGDRVVYVPRHANGNRHHPDCERGVVSSVNAKGVVFVKFDHIVGRLGWIGATAQGCEAGALLPDEWTATHTHIERGGAYRREGSVQIKIDSEGGRWVEGVQYSNKDGRQFACSVERWNARFRPLEG